MIDAPSSSVALPTEFDDGRGRLPDRIQAKAPRGMRNEIRRAAEVAGTSAAGFIRQAVAERISKTLTALMIVAASLGIAPRAHAQDDILSTEITLFPERIVIVRSGTTYRVTRPNVIVCAATGAPLKVVPMISPPEGASVTLKDCNTGHLGLFASIFEPAGGTKVEDIPNYQVGGYATKPEAVGQGNTFRFLAGAWRAF